MRFVIHPFGHGMAPMIFWVRATDRGRLISWLLRFEIPTGLYASQPLMHGLDPDG